MMPHVRVRVKPARVLPRRVTPPPASPFGAGLIVQVPHGGPEVYTPEDAARAAQAFAAQRERESRPVEDGEAFAMRMAEGWRF